jgi:uncharacterized membrane protein YbhN (UPF0104 family)
VADSRYLPALRATFLVAVLVFAWLGLHDRIDEIGSALRATSFLGVALALLSVLAGLLATGLLWLRLMAALGADLAFREGLSTFFVGQLGKYIPGSVWSIGAQAHMAGRRSVPPRTTVAAGLLFLGYHVTTAVMVGAATLLLGGLASPWPPWFSVLLLVGSAVGLLPAVVRRLGRRIAGRSASIGVGDTAVALALMAMAWAAYSTGLVLLSPGSPWRDVVALGGAFALAYAVGVVIVLAPAGLGAREALFVLLLTPLLGVAGAAALALLARLVHTVADGVMAAAWWYAASGRAAPGRADRPRARTTPPSMPGHRGG